MGMEDGETGWFRPDPRAIIPLDAFHATRSLRRSADRYEVRFDTAYEQVMRACANRKDVWITEELFHVYAELFRRGTGHSAEAFLSDRLVGGVYGVSLGGAFMAESMFHSETDAGKVALWKLIEKLRDSGWVLFDVQYMTPHLKTLGAIEISHSEYIRRLEEALEISPDW